MSVVAFHLFHFIPPPENLENAVSTIDVGRNQLLKLLGILFGLLAVIGIASTSRLLELRTSNSQTGQSRRPIRWMATLSPGETAEPDPGLTPTLLLSHEQAIDHAKMTLGIANPGMAIARRTTELQVAGLIAQINMVHSIRPTPTLPAIGSDDSAVVWFVVLHTSEGRSAAQVLRTIGIPVDAVNPESSTTSGTASPGGSSTSGPLGHYPYLEMDEIGNNLNSGFVDVYDTDGDGQFDPYPDHMAAISSLPEVDPSITATPGP